MDDLSSHFFTMVGDTCTAAGLANIGAMELDAVVYVIESAGGKVVDANDGIAFVQ